VLWTQTETGITVPSPSVTEIPGFGRAEIRRGGILSADLDLADLPRAKFNFDVVGHYARPDVFRLEVKEQPMKSVSFR
jgi:hypothetical protein